MAPTAYYGAVINPQERNPHEPISYNAWPKSLLAVSEDGRIIRVVPHVSESDIKDILEREGLQDCVVVKLSSGEFIMPGFVDTHTVCLNVHLMQRTATDI
jgi:guanine deaminase